MQQGGYMKSVYVVLDSKTGFIFGVFMKSEKAQEFGVKYCFDKEYRISCEPVMDN